jgi:DNA polymerase elongation subunit (family B)
LYPNTIVTLNISPETKLGKVLRMDVEKDEYEFMTTSGRKHTFNKMQFDEYIRREEICISKSNIMFTQKTRGIFSEIIEEIYAERVKIKTEMKRISDLNATHPDDVIKNNYQMEQLDTAQDFA